MIYAADQLTGFYMRATLALNGLKLSDNVIPVIFIDDLSLFLILHEQQLNQDN